MIELKGIDAAFPLVGEFTLTNGESFDYSLVQNNGAVVSVALLDRLQLRLGDSVKIAYVKKGDKLVAVTIAQSKVGSPVLPSDLPSASRK